MHTPVRTLPTLLLAIGLTACGEAQPGLPEGVQELLVRPVDELSTTDRRIEVDPVACLGERELAGWREEAEHGGFPRRDFALTEGAEASLALNAAGPAERELELTLWAQAGEGSVTVSLNGVDLGTRRLTDGPEELAFEAPAPAWVAGRNILGLRLSPPESPPVLAFERLEVSPAEAIERRGPDGRDLRLDPGTTAGWTLEHAGPGILDLELASTSSGTAVLTRARMRGALPSHEAAAAADPDPREERRIPVTAGAPAAVRLQLPAPHLGSPTTLALEWQGATAPLSVERLELFEDRPLERPPILFLTIDTLAARNLSVQGYGRRTTPNLARFAEDAVLFESARSNAPWTVPSYASQLTGLYAHSNKLSPNMSIPAAQRGAGWRYYEVIEERWTLAEALQAAGYRTTAFVDNLWLTRVVGFRQGFERFDTEAAERHHGEDDGGAGYVLPGALEELERDDPRPPFVLAHMFDVHGPYLPGDEAGGFAEAPAAPGLPASLPVVPSGSTLFGTIPGSIARGRAPKGDLPTTMDPAPLWADYDEAILTLDRLLGEFFERLRASGLYDETLIIVSADHGESMVDHDYHFSHGLCYDSALHVPLIVKLPGQAHAGRRVSEPVQLVDLYPTLLDLVGLPVGPLARPELHGRSLVPAIEGGALEPVPQLGQADVLEQSSLVHGPWKLVVSRPSRTSMAVLCSHATIQGRLHHQAPELFVELFGTPPPVDPRLIRAALAGLEQRDPDLHGRARRLVEQGPPMLELFDLSKDPDELHDRSADEPEVLAELLAHLQAELDRAAAARSDKGPAKVELSPELLDELQRLGYLGDE